MSATAATTARERQTRSRIPEAIFILQASRPGLWSTQIWFYLLPLAERDVFHSPAFWLGVLYCTFPLGLLLYGWNDYVDFEIDHDNPRKGNFLFGARGSREQLRKLPVCIALLQVPFLIAFWYLGGPRMLLWFAGTVAAAGIYNWPRYGFKSRPPLEIFNQAGYLFVFVLSSWLNHVPQLPAATLVFGALFAMHSHVFGEIMDLEPDRASGRRTTATVIGRVSAKLLIAALLAAECALVFVCFRDVILSGFLLASGLWFALDGAFIWRAQPYTPGQMKFAMLAWNVIALGSMPWVWWNASLIAVR
jgi:4-hydroxybenzoate polyprenyltransferase